MLLTTLLCLGVNLTIQGAHQTSKDFLREEMALEEFASVDSASLDSLVRDREARLMETGAFALVKCFGSLEDTSVNLLLVLYEMPFVLPYPYLGYDDRTGWTGGLSLHFTNLWGSAHRADIGSLLGGQRALVFSYDKPASFGHRGDLKADAFWGNMRWVHEYATERRTNLSLSLGRAFFWPHVLGVGGFYEAHSFDSSSFTISDDSSDQLAGARVFWEQRALDNALRPRRGVKIRLDITRAWELSGAGGFSGLALKARAYATRSRFTLAARLDVEMQSSRTPYYKRYYMGGIYALRSYEYPTYMFPSRALFTLEARTLLGTWVPSWLPLPLEFYAVPFVEAGTGGTGDELGGYLWGGGLGGGVFTLASGYVGGDVCVNRQGNWRANAYLGWPF